MSGLTVQRINNLLTQGYWIGTGLFWWPKGLKDLRSFVKETTGLGEHPAAELDVHQIRRLINIFEQRNIRMRPLGRFYQFKNNRTDQIFLKLMPLLFVAAKAKGIAHECLPLFASLPEIHHVPREHKDAYGELYTAKISSVIAEARKYSLPSEEGAKSLYMAIRSYGVEAIDILRRNELQQAYFGAINERDVNVIWLLSTRIQFSEMQLADKEALFRCFIGGSMRLAQMPSDFLKRCILGLDAHFFDNTDNQSWLLRQPATICKVLNYHRDNDLCLPQWLSKRLFLNPILGKQLGEHPVSESRIALKAYAEIEHALISSKGLYLGPKSYEILSKGYKLMRGELSVASRIHLLLLEYFSGYPGFLKEQIRRFIGPMPRSIETPEELQSVKEKWCALIRIIQQSTSSREKALRYLKALLPDTFVLTQHVPLEFSCVEYSKAYSSAPSFAQFPFVGYAKLMGKYHVGYDTFVHLGELDESLRAPGYIERILKHRQLMSMHVQTLNKLAHLAQRNGFTGLELKERLLITIDKTFSHLNPNVVVYKACLNRAFNELPNKDRYHEQYKKLSQDPLVVIMPSLEFTTEQLGILLQLNPSYFLVDDLAVMQADRRFRWDEESIKLLNWAVQKSEYREDDESYYYFVERCRALKTAEECATIPVLPEAPAPEPAQHSFHQLENSTPFVNLCSKRANCLDASASSIGYIPDHSNSHGCSS